jgi:hypothetical protein
VALHGNLYRDTVVANDYGRAIIFGGASVRFYLPDGQAPPVPYPGVLYPGPDDPTPITLPYVTGANGEIEVWADSPVRLRMEVSAPGRATAVEVIDVEPDPATAATDQDITSAVAAHEQRPDDPHAPAGYVTQAETDLLYLPLAHAPGTDPHPQYLARSEWGTADPLGQYQLETEKGQPSGYAPLDPNRLLPTVHLPPLAITDTFVVASEAEMLALTAERGDLAIRSDTNKSYILAADPASTLANWKELSSSAPVLSVNGYTGVVNLTNDDVGAVALAGDTMTGTLHAPAVFVASKPLVVDPAPGNILTWGGSGLNASLATANVTVLKREEFSPAPAATTVTLASAPTTVLEVSRNGVAQSQAAGHYSVAGAVVTFSDAFAAGERVLVLYELGTSVVTTPPVDAYDKATSDSRFVNVAGDTMTGDLTFANLLTPSGYVRFAGDTTLERLTTGLLQVNGKQLLDTTEGDGRYLQSATAAATYVPLAGGSVLTGLLGPTANNTLDLGTTALKWRTAYLGTAVIVGTTPASVGGIRLPTGNNGRIAWRNNGNTADLTLRADTSDNLVLSTHFVPATTNASDLGSYTGPLRWRTVIAGIGDFGGYVNVGGAITSSLSTDVSDALDVRVSSDAQYRFRLLASGEMQWGPGASAVQDTFLKRTGTGALRVDTHLGVGVNPAAWASSIRAVQVGDAGAFRGGTGTNVVLASNTFHDGTNQRPLVGGSGASQWILNANTAELYTAPAVGAGVNQTFTARLSVAPTGTLTLTPDAATAHIVGALASGSFSLAPWTELDQNSLRIRASTYISVDPLGNYFLPLRTNAIYLGSGSNYWVAVHAQTGTIQPSHVSTKEHFVRLAPAACVEAVLTTDWLEFDYKTPEPLEGAPEPSEEQRAQDAAIRHQRGYVLGSDEYATSDLFGMGDRKSASPSTDLAVVACALQQALKDIADLKARLPA